MHFSCILWSSNELKEWKRLHECMKKECTYIDNKMHSMFNAMA